MSNVARLRYLTLRKTANLAFAFKQISWTCFWNDNVESSQTPKCLCCWTLSTIVSLKSTGGELNKVLLEKIISLDLPGLKVTFQVWAQAEIFARSLHRMSAVSAGSFALAKRQVSSANYRASDWRQGPSTCIWSSLAIKPEFQHLSKAAETSKYTPWHTWPLDQDCLIMWTMYSSCWTVESPFK